MEQNHRPRRRAGLVILGMAVVAVSAVGLAAAVGWGPDQPVSDQEPALASETPASVVEGVVTDAQGGAVVGATVQARPLPGSPPVPDLVVTTDESGHYRWALPPGDYELVATTPDGASEPVEVAVEAGTTEADLLVDP
jgi:Carboxypeptidase regulatory-like domain